MRWKLLRAAALGAVLMCAPVGWNAAAAEEYAAQEEYEKAIGLIEKCTLTCNLAGNGLLNISAKTQVSSVMEEVGYKNVVVQRSDDGENWEDEVYLGDFIGYNTKYYSLSNLQVEVSGKGQYRVVCDHYAKGIPFGEKEVKTQTATNSSSWSEKPVITSANPMTTKQTTTTTTTTVTVQDKTETQSSSSKATVSSSTSSKNTTSSAGSKTTTSAATTTAKTTKTTAKTDAEETPTGAKSPAMAVAVLACAGAAGWAVRKKR